MVSTILGLPGDHGLRHQGLQKFNEAIAANRNLREQ